MMMFNELRKDIDVYLSYSNLLDNNHEVKFLSESSNNINFLIDAESEKYLFRLNKHSELKLRNQIRYEYDALKTLEKSYVTPRTFFLDDSTTFFDYGVLIMQFIEGRHLEYDNQKDLQEAAKILAKIDSLDTKKIDVSNFIVRENIIKDSLDKSKAYLEKYKDDKNLDISIKLKIHTLFEWAERNKDCASYFEKDKWQTINNTETNSKNFIISKKKTKGFLIDWEKPVVADPSLDIAYFLSPITSFINGDYILSQDEKDDFFKTYIMYLDKCDRDIIERVRVYTPYLNLLLLCQTIDNFLNIEDKNSSAYKNFLSIVNIEFIDDLFKGIL